LRKMKRHFESADVLLRVNPETVKVLKSNNAAWLVEFEELTGKNILVKSDATLHPEQFDIQG
jgi:ribonuclease E